VPHGRRVKRNELRVLTYLDDEGPRVGVELDGGVAPTSFRDMLELIRAGREGLARAAAEAESGSSVRPERVLAPLRPGKMFGGGINFAGHLEENPGATLPEEPFFFSKLPSSVIGPDEPIVLPFRGLDVDYEVELAVVIGTAAKDVPYERALDHVFGYTVHNDVGARGIQFKEAQITLGKNPDTFAPLGPAIVTADEIPDPAALHIESRVNGEPRQSESCGAMRFDVPTAIEWISSIITLEPGDVITMGTPAGCGTFRNPPLWLEPGDVVTVSERTIGELTNPVVAGPRYDTDFSEIRRRSHRPT
jgi:2-keto-4-pentenoate hydratase/2-oxohepta-3-ene-1,7-dioic acid hydratase in catechol pathway